MPFVPSPISPAVLTLSPSLPPSLPPHLGLPPSRSLSNLLFVPLSTSLSSPPLSLPPSLPPVRPEQRGLQDRLPEAPPADAQEGPAIRRPAGQVKRKQLPPSQRQHGLHVETKAACFRSLVQKPGCEQWLEGMIM